MPKKNEQEPLLSNKTDVVIRHCIILAMAMLFSLEKTGAGTMQFGGYRWFLFISFTFLLIAVIWNGNVWLIDVLDKKLGWQNHVVKKILYNLIIAISWPLIVHTGFNAFVYPIFMGEPCSLSSTENITQLLTTVLVTLFINAIFTSIAFFKFWRQSVKETEALKRASITAEFEALKNQINPHFLFNSLNTLTNLIEEDTNLATQFVLKLAEVYRYILNQKDKQLVSLKDELDFIESYIYLNQIRFGSNLVFKAQITPEHYNKMVASLSLQILVENCIKHNIISAQKPLYINLFTNDENLVVSNNLQLKNNLVPSNGIGLANIIGRYKLLTTKAVEVTNNNNQFVVKLPLLNN